MNKPILSIIVPVYNEEEHLNKCIDSILSQTYDSYEVILVDDGSTDSSSALCDKYTDNPNVKVIHKSNGGAISARKVGVKTAIGEYIGFVDSDDWIESDMFLLLMNNAVMHNADIVTCGYYLDGIVSTRIVSATEKNTVLDNVNSNSTFLSGILATGFDWANNRNITPSLCNKVFRKENIEQVFEKIDERIVWYEDTVAVLTAVLDCKCIVLIPEILYHYRQNISSITHRTNRGILQNYVYTFNELERISEEHEGILDNQIPFFALSAARLALEVGFGVKSGKQYMFPFGDIPLGSRIIIYGAGQVGICYYKELNLVNFVPKPYITDSNPKNWVDEVICPDDAFKHDYDIVLIAVDEESTANNIKASLIKRGVDKDKIFWKKPKILSDTYMFYIN